MTAPRLQPIVIWFGRVGDLILLSTLLDILHRRYGRACHLIGAGSWLAELYAAHPDVARVSCLHRYTAWLFDPAWWRTWRALRSSRASPVYVCETDPRKLARIQRLLRLSGTGAARCLFIAREPSPGSTHWVDAQTGLDTALPHASKIAPTHWVDRLVSFGRLTPPACNAADYPWPTPPPRGTPLLQVAAAVRAECSAWLDAQGWHARPLVLVQPGNRRTMRRWRWRPQTADDKAWPIERWAALLQRVGARLPQAQIVLCGAPRESQLLRSIAAATQSPAVTAAELPLPRLLALCERAHSMISVDTGPAHAAAALGVPLVVLFGGLPQAEWLPRSPSGSQVSGLGGPPYSERLEQISVETVFAAWCALDTTGRLAVTGAPAGAAGSALSPAARAIAP
jgi:ADP-heptose:LPS heptosyltransferase